ncbi:MAG: VWA domain-containing protein [Acidobacteria bacterium]|nr:VWA domain-containing protein [Candidatus Sulfomarinibacter sp. MAG AM1]
MSFAEPARLALLVAPAVAAMLAYFRHRRRLRQQRRLASPGVWRRLLGGVPSTGWIRLLAWCGAAALVVLAVARPQWGELPAEETIRTRDLVVALDVSDSMLCPDLRPSRLVRSIEALIHLLPEIEGNRVAVVVFSGEAYALVPLTTDLGAVAVFLGGVQPGMVALPGSNLERAVDSSLDLLPEEGEGRVLLLFTDGENLQGDVGDATAALREAGVGMLGVVAGTEQGGPIPEIDDSGGVHYKRDADGQPVVTRAHPEVLQEIADSVDGEVVPLSDPDVVREIAAAVERLRTREVEATRSVRRIERFPLFLAGAAVLLMVGFTLSPWRRVATAALVLGLVAPTALAQQGVSPAGSAPSVRGPPATTEAADGALPEASWWQRLIPGGSRRLARKGVGRWRAADVEGATTAFAGAAELEPEQPKRLYDLGTALAASGNLETAFPMLEAANEGGVRGAAYNSGTAALGGMQAEAALSWLRSAMLEDPGDVEAKHNYELALRLREEQQQQQQQQDQQQDQDQENQEQKENDEGGEPTPTPTPAAGQGAAPTPTPDPNQPLYAALERAEAEARETMRSPTPRAGKVEKDW